MCGLTAYELVYGFHHYNDCGHFFDTGIFIEEFPFALLCKLFGLHWHIVEHQLRLDKCKGFTSKKLLFYFKINMYICMQFLTSKTVGIFQG